ncbi:MAG: hypothetical protein SGARI_007583, partial [Bacillariaceae sp.]
FTYQEIELMRVDALIAERMTASPRIFDFYGYCGIASFSEFALHGTIEEDLGGDYIPKKAKYDFRKHNNDASPAEKVEYCLQMALAVADLHGHKDGMIVHEDLKSDQFLWNADQSAIKLNDFSRSVIMRWDDNTQSYCMQDENEQREWRTPEEAYWSHYIDEKVDIHNLAGVFYYVLIGQSKIEAMQMNDDEYLLMGGSITFDKKIRK